MGPIHPGAPGGQGRPQRKAGVEPDVEWDLTFLMAVLNWAARSRDEHGRLLLDRNPLKGLRMLGVSRQVGWRFRVALVLAHETGHRIGAIRNLRWRDIDFEDRTVLWRAEHEKTGYEHTTPLTGVALAALEEARRMGAGGGDAPVLPAPARPSQCLGRYLALRWWYRAATLAGLEPKRGRGWHSLGRKFASDLMDLPLKVLCDLGGWKNAQTVLRCYQRPDAGQLRTALESRRGVCG